MYDIIINIITESWQVLGQMAFYLLFGFLVAGVLSVCISPKWVERALGGALDGTGAEGVPVRRAAAALFLWSDPGLGLYALAWRKQGGHDLVFALHAPDRP